MILAALIISSVYSSSSRCVDAFSFTNSRNSNNNANLVPRITLDEYLASPIYKTPVLISGICSPESIESLGDELMNDFGKEMVQMQRKRKNAGNDRKSRSRKHQKQTTTTEIYDVPLEESIGYMMDSSHCDSYFAFCEGLLPSPTDKTNENPSSNLTTKLRKVREAPFSTQENWFDYFPPSIQPTDAIILAGAGATSTLHRDPFEWTGTSLCLEGTKLWRFILPPSEVDGGVAVVDEALRSYRLDSIAWENDNGNDSIVLSAGWQSDMTLYESTANDFPSAFDWVSLEEDDEDLFRQQMEDAGMDISCLCPSAEALGALDIISNSGSIDSENDGQSKKASLFVTAIQQPGDLLLIPAHCWHQTYAPVPSVAVASQRCGASADGPNVIHHILELAAKENEKNLPDILQSNTYNEGTGEEAVSRLLTYLLV